MKLADVKIIHKLFLKNGNNKQNIKTASKDRNIDTILYTTVPSALYEN
jgi:hypothetical protein